MRECIVTTLILLSLPHGSAQVVPAGWQAVKDSRNDAKNACQIAVPPDWSLLGDNSGAAFFHDVSTAIAAVTSQPGQAFRPLTESLQKLLHISRETLFENTAGRIFYRDRTSAHPEDPSSYSVSVPGKSGTCSAHVTFLPSVPEDVVRKIALSLGPVPETREGTF